MDQMKTGRFLAELRKEKGLTTDTADSKRRQSSLKKIICALAAAAVCAGLLIYTGRPYQPVSFVLDGEGYSAEVVNGDRLLLQLDNENKTLQWFSVMTPEFLTPLPEEVPFFLRSVKEGMNSY